MARIGEIAHLVQRIRESGAELPDLLAARLALKTDHPRDALALLRKALAGLKGRPSFDIVRIWAMQALAWQALGEEKQALAALRQALELGEPEERIASFVREGEAMERLLRQPKVRALAPTFVNRLLAAFEARRRLQPRQVPVTETLIEPLSERELEILGYLNSYLSTPEIAEVLVVSANTVRTHIKNIYGKLGVHGRSGAVKCAMEMGLLA
jgi:LuxR family maltose regulon positive regulatory protein